MITCPAAVPFLAGELGGGALVPRVEINTALSKRLPTVHVTGVLLQDLDLKELGHPKTPVREMEREETPGRDEKCSHGHRAWQEEVLPPTPSPPCQSIPSA